MLIPVLIGIVAICFNIWVLVQFVHLRTSLKPYLPAAIAVAVGLLVYESVLVVSSDQVLGLGSLALLTVVAIRNVLLISLGLHYYDVTGTGLLHRFVQPARYWWVASLGLLLLWVAFTVLLFQLTQPRTVIDMPLVPSIAGVAVVVLLAIGEEIFFRLGLQNVLAHYLKRPWLAILISTSIWTLSHWGQIDPNWVKMVQVFFPGLLLGWLNLRYGILAPVFVHAVFNALMIAYA